MRHILLFLTLLLSLQSPTNGKTCDNDEVHAAWNTLRHCGVSWQPISHLIPKRSHRFAVIGDFGADSPGEADVATMVHEWDSQDRLTAILTVGDNNYEIGSQSTVENNVGKYYWQYMYPYKSYVTPPLYKGAPDKQNRFYPCPGNHDWGEGNLDNYLDYFAGVNNSYYYTKSLENTDVFMLDSDPHQDAFAGTSVTSEQATWLKQALSRSKAVWKLVLFHHPPFSSGEHGNTEYMNWPFWEWGAHIVISGHEHDYERIVLPQGACPSFPYIVTGLAGAKIRSFKTPIQGSVKRFNANFGASLIEVTDDTLSISFVSVDKKVQDSMKLTKSSSKCGFDIDSDSKQTA